MDGLRRVHTEQSHLHRLAVHFDRLAPGKEAVVELPPTPLPAPGVYCWQVLGPGAAIHERKLVVGRTG